MKRFTKSGALVVAFTAATLVVVVGCGNDDPTLTKQQMDGMRHPTAVAGYKGPDPAAQAKIGQEMEAFNKKHQNDKIEFVR